MARTKIGAIIDQLVTLQQTLDVDKAYDEAPEHIAGPSWVNFPYSGIIPHAIGPGGSDFAEDTHTIICACIKERALLPEDEQIMRPLITEFPDALSGDLTLGGTVEHIDTVEYEYGAIEMMSPQAQPMFGVLFRVTVTVKDLVSFAL